jgi:oxygen-independent coproporphyrinogen-3 oxidase
MCYLAVDLDAIACAHGGRAEDLLTPALEVLASDGVIRREGPRLAVTALGRPFLRSVAAAFDGYIGGVGSASGPRHSQGV